MTTTPSHLAGSTPPDVNLAPEQHKPLDQQTRAVPRCKGPRSSEEGDRRAAPLAPLPNTSNPTGHRNPRSSEPLTPDSVTPLPYRRSYQYAGGASCLRQTQIMTFVVQKPGFVPDAHMLQSWDQICPETAHIPAPSRTPPTQQKTARPVHEAQERAVSSPGSEPRRQRPNYSAFWPALNGKPSSRRRARPSSSFEAVVTTVMFIPRGRSMESTSIS